MMQAWLALPSGAVWWGCGSCRFISLRRLSGLAVVLGEVFSKGWAGRLVLVGLCAQHAQYAPQFGVGAHQVVDGDRLAAHAGCLQLLARQNQMRGLLDEGLIRRAQIVGAKLDRELADQSAESLRGLRSTISNPR